MLRVLLCTLWFALGPAPAAQAQDAASLLARHASLREPLATHTLNRALYLESTETSGGLKGDVYAQLAQPYAATRLALQGIDAWCDILILHLNVKACHAAAHPGGDTLQLDVGRKADQPLADAYRFDFSYNVVTASPDYLQVALRAEQGPLGTRQYRIVLEVAALDSQRSLVHLSYAYEHGVTARLAMQTYLSTVGRGKVGFSVVGHHADGQPVYVGGLRGVVERNTMRYYLAIVAYLDAQAAPAPQQLERRLNAWHTSVERYPIQLHELERDDYLAMKRREVERQRTLAAP